MGTRRRFQHLRPPPRYREDTNDERGVSAGMSTSGSVVVDRERSRRRDGADRGEARVFMFDDDEHLKLNLL